MTSPPGVNGADFADAIAGFQAAVGKDRVFTSIPMASFRLAATASGQSI